MFEVRGLDEVKTVARNVGRLASAALPEVDAVVKRGAQNIKDEMVNEAKGSRTLGSRLAGSISYDSRYGVGSVAYELGPDKSRKGGPLGNIYYFGTSRGGGTGDLEGPMLREAPELEKHLGNLMAKWGDSL